jgi:hypothetical protein
MIYNSIFKACKGKESWWPTVTPHIFWANCATTRKSTGYSPFFMAHGIEPILPFDLVQATFLVPDLINPLSTTDLLAICTCQLEKHPANLTTIHNCIYTSHYTSIHQFEKQYTNTIHNFDFILGTLILVRNTNLTMDKMKPQQPFLSSYHHLWV